MAYFLEYCYFLKKEKKVRSKMGGREEGGRKKGRRPESGNEGKKEIHKEIKR